MSLIRKITGIFGNVLWVAFIGYLVYALLVSTFAYRRQPPVSEQAKARFEQTNFYGGAAWGPDKITLVETTEEAFNVRMNIIRTAQHKLDFVCHTVKGGSATQALFGELWLAAERGVEIRILLDGKTGLAGKEAQEAMQLLCSHPNVQYSEYNPPGPWKVWAWHTLLHDKFMIADSELLLLGGRNWGDRYFAPDEYAGKTTNDRDVLVWNTGSGGESVLVQAEDYMNLLWDFEETQPQAPRRIIEGEKLVRGMEPYVQKALEMQVETPGFYTLTMQDYLERMVPTHKISLIYNPLETRCNEPWVGYQLAQLARTAKHSLQVQTPYATANPLMLQIFEEAAQNATVTLLTNSLASSPNYPAFSNYYSQRDKFLATGAEIYEFQSKHSIHGKSIVVDNRLSAVGSFNMDDRSLYIDTETMLVVDSEAFAKALTGAMDEYRAQSLQVESKKEYVYSPDVEAAPVPRGKKILMQVVSVFSRLFSFLI